MVTVTLNRPQRKNAATRAVWEGLLEVFRDASRDPSTRVLVVTGSGGDFCSGADVEEMATGSGGAPQENPLERMRFLGEVALSLHRFPKPTIAKVRGIAAGAGLGMALACDLVVASETARFSEIFVRRALSPDFGTSWLLPRLVGLQKAKELAYLADIIDAEEAGRIGLVNKVVADEDLDTIVSSWASRLAAGPPLALSLTKGLLDHSMGIGMAEALEAEARSQVVNFASTDTAEALHAFIEHREPRYSGR